MIHGLILLIALGAISCNRLSRANREREGRYEQFGLQKAQKLKAPINTRHGEYSPSISADGKTLVFQSNREKDRRWRLYVSHLSPSGWSDPEPLDSINSSSFNGTPFITYDQNRLIISSRRPGGAGEIDVWIARRLGEVWKSPDNFEEPVNSRGNDGFASLSANGKTLYFQRYAGRETGCDLDYLNNVLMYSELRDGLWTEPQKLPEPINTIYCETDPVILADGRTLIFSSNRPGGFGGFDLYKTELQSDGSWSDPVNLGSFINTNKHDQAVSIPASGDILYFTSGKPERGDLYWTPIPKSFQPLPVATVSGRVMDGETKDPLEAKITVINSGTGRDTTVVRSNQVDGDYMVILNAGERYDVAVTAEGYTFFSTEFDLTSLLTYQSIQQDIYLERIKAGTQIVLNNIFFEFNKYRLLDESKYELNRAVELMLDYPEMTVEIAGHTDSIASEQYNLDLSQKRAGAVVDYLVEHGIANTRLSPRGYGESEPVADNGTDEGRQQNRRVEFRILSVTAEDLK